MNMTKENFEISISAAGLKDIGITRATNEDACAGRFERWRPGR